MVPLGTFDASATGCTWANSDRRPDSGERGHVAESFCSGRLRPNYFTRHLSLDIPPQAFPSTPHESARPIGPEWSHLVRAITLHDWGRHRPAHPPHAGHGPSQLTAPTTTRSGLPHERDRSLARRPASYVRPRLTVSSALSLAKARKSAILGDPSHWPTGRDHSLHGIGLEVKAPNQDAWLAWRCVSIPRSTILDYPPEPAHQRSISRSASTQPKVDGPIDVSGGGPQPTSSWRCAVVTS
jgi:hypothetical protein